MADAAGGEIRSRDRCLSRSLFHQFKAVSDAIDHGPRDVAQVFAKEGRCIFD